MISIIYRERDHVGSRMIKVCSNLEAFKLCLFQFSSTHTKKILPGATSSAPTWDDEPPGLDA